jgi:hypothetical protein
MKTKFILFFILILSITLFAKDDLSIFPEMKIKKSNKSNFDSSFKSTYDKLIDVVENKNYDKLKEFLSSDHESNFECSKEKFDSCWNMSPSSYKNSKLWQILSIALKKGGIKEGEYIIFPYYTQAFPKGYGGYDYSFIDGVKANIRSKPNKSSKVIANYSYVIVRRSYDKSKNRETIGGVTDYWYPIITPNGQKGYVFGKFLSSSVDCRIFFKKYNGKWLIKYIACGD